MTTQKGLLWQMDSDMLSNSDVGQKHELLDELVSIGARILPAVRGQPVVIQLERQTKRVKVESAILETTGPHVLCKALQDFDVMGNVGSVMFGGDDKITKDMTINDFLSVRVGKFGGRSRWN
jgi:hypothetical protein